MVRKHAKIGEHLSRADVSAYVLGAWVFKGWRIVDTTTRAVGQALKGVGQGIHETAGLIKDSREAYTNHRIQVAERAAQTAIPAEVSLAQTPLASQEVVCEELQSGNALGEEALSRVLVRDQH